MEVKGLICSKCNAKLLGENIKVVDRTNYEGISVAVFICPVCGEKTDDLQSDWWMK